MRTLIYSDPSKHNAAERVYLDTRHAPDHYVCSGDSAVGWGTYCARRRFASERLNATL